MSHSLSTIESDSLATAREVIRIEAEAVAALEERIGPEFERAVELILNAPGKVIITGVGKSHAIGQKIAATLSSTGTSAFYLHSVDGIHGDSGMVSKNDVVICISKSGVGDELNILLSIFKRLGVPVIAMVGKKDSPLARQADIVLDIGVRTEACPFDLAPTASTTATLVLGDALAVALLKRRNFDEEDFALLHPGGNLGRRLLMKVEELMFVGEDIPRVSPDALFKEFVVEMNRKRFGATCVADSSGKLLGIVTDGDLKRLLERRDDFLSLRAGDVMTPTPKTASPDDLAVSALNKMKKHNIMQLVVVDRDLAVMGMIHIHDLLKAGLS